MSAASRSRIADPTLAPAGEQRIRWVQRHSPVLNRLARERLADGALRGRRVAVVVHLEAKTAYLALLLRRRARRSSRSGANPGSTQDAVCAALVARGVEVHARHGASPDEFDADLLTVADDRARARRRRRLRADVKDRRASAGDACATARRHRGDDHRRRAPAGAGRRRQAHVPGDRGQRRSLQAPVRQPLRDGPVDARRRSPADEPVVRRPRVLRRRVRLGRQGPGALRAGRGRPRHGRRNRPRRGARRAHGRLTGSHRLDGRAARRGRARHGDGRDRRGARAKPCRCSRTAPCSRTAAITSGRSRRGAARLPTRRSTRAPACRATISATGAAHVLADGRQTNVAGGRRPSGRDHGPVVLRAGARRAPARAAASWRRGSTRSRAALDDEIARTKLATLGIELGEPTAAQREFGERWSVG